MLHRIDPRHSEPGSLDHPARSGARPAALADVDRALTVQDFLRRPDRVRREEPVRGRIIDLAPLSSRHGQVCGQAYFLLRLFVEARRDGILVCNNSGVVTARNPDTVRGVDLAYYPLNRIPGGTVPSLGHIEAPPELVVEVLSPRDSWPALLTRAAEFLNGGVSTVVLLDPDTASAQVYDQVQPVRILQESDELRLGGDLDGFHARVGRFFG